MLIESYVIRIYRRHAGGGHGFVGLVEADGTGGQRSFSTVEELWETLTERPTEMSDGPEPRAALREGS